MLWFRTPCRKNADLRFINGNDGTCEGIFYRNHPAFSVQFHPEAAGGPQDTAFYSIGLSI